jgi:hypothetical protein
MTGEKIPSSPDAESDQRREYISHSLISIPFTAGSIYPCQRLLTCFQPGCNPLREHNLRRIRGNQVRQQIPLTGSKDSVLAS